MIGEEAHIVARAQAGPRHTLEPDGGYDGLANLVLLCKVCHAIVDAQPVTYPAEALRELRDRHVEWVKARTGSMPPFPRLHFTPIPANIELRLIGSGRQLVDVVCSAEDVSFRHDQPRSAADAALMSGLLKRVEEADMEIDAIGSHHVVALSQDFHALLLEQLLPRGIIVLGANAQRTVSTDGATLPWTTCVLSLQYAPHTAEPHGSIRSDRPDAAPADLSSTLQSLLADGRAARSRARISADGSCASIEIWERDVRQAVEKHDRHDLLERFDTAARPDLARLISGPWATRRRLDRELAVLAEIVGERTS